MLQWFPYLVGKAATLLSVLRGLLLCEEMLSYWLENKKKPKYLIVVKLCQYNFPVYLT